MAKKQAERRTGTTRLKGRPLDDDGAIELTVLGADEDEVLARSAGQAVMEFMRGLAGFFTTAKALEGVAFKRLEQAKTLTAPTTAEADEAVQRFIKATSADRREVEEHWKITATISGFHRRMTARRAKATDALEQANTIGNKLHNTYVEGEKRRAAEEQERKRREAEEQARRDRDLELARMEEEAMRRDEASATLSAREVAFVEFVHNGVPNQTAAQRAGYHEPLKAAARLMSAPKIQQALRAKAEAAAIRKQAAAVKDLPLDVQVETVQPNVIKFGTERTTHAAELLDEGALVAAILGGKHGIPTDLLRIDTVRLNQYARDLEKRIELWPGVRYKKTTKVI